jgi:hypothetical protein
MLVHYLSAHPLCQQLLQGHIGFLIQVIQLIPLSFAILLQQQQQQQQQHEQQQQLFCENCASLLLFC